jgi:hypothetical protein
LPLGLAVRLRTENRDTTLSQTNSQRKVQGKTLGGGGETFDGIEEIPTMRKLAEDGKGTPSDSIVKSVTHSLIRLGKHFPTVKRRWESIGG